MIPSEIVESSQIAYIGKLNKYSSVSNLNIYLPTGEKNIFSNGIHQICLTSYKDLKMMSEQYQSIILCDNSCYESKNKTRAMNISAAELELDRNHLKTVHQYLNILFDGYTKNSNYTIFKESLYHILNKVKSANFYMVDYGCDVFSIANIPTIAPIDFYSPDNQRMPSSTRGKYLKEIATVPENSDSIIINLSTLQSFFYDQVEKFSNGMLQISKTSPMQVTPINVTQEELEWIIDFFNNYNKDKTSYRDSLGMTLQFYSACIEDIAFATCRVMREANSLQCEPFIQATINSPKEIPNLQAKCLEYYPDMAYFLESFLDIQVSRFKVSEIGFNEFYFTTDINKQKNDAENLENYYHYLFQIYSRLADQYVKQSDVSYDTLYPIKLYNYLNQNPSYNVCKEYPIFEKRILEINRRK